MSQEVIDMGWNAYISQANSGYVDVGFFDEGGEKMPPTPEGKQTDITLVELAAIQEFGAEINVTGKMRAYLHHNGFHLRSDKTKIIIPSRPFMRQAFDQGAADLSKFVSDQENLILKQLKTRDEALEDIGQYHKNQIQEMILGGDFVPNHSFTIERKGSNKPLNDTGIMRNAVDYKVGVK